MRRLFAERHDALLAALAADAHVLLLEVDVREIEPDRLSAAQTGRVDELDESEVAECEGPVTGQRVQDRLHLLALRRFGQPLGTARPERGVRHARGAECEPEERPDRRQLACDRGRGEAVAGAAELRRVVDQHAHVDRLDVDLAPVEPAVELAQVGRVRPPGRLGQGGRSEVTVDRGARVHAGRVPTVVLRSCHTAALRGLKA